MSGFQRRYLSAAERAEHEDEMEVREMLLALGSDLSQDGTYGDELLERLHLEARVFPCHSVRSVRPGRWYRYALAPPQPRHSPVPEVIARSHGAAVVVLAVELMERTGREAPPEMRAMAARVLSEEAVTWCAPQSYLPGPPHQTGTSL